MAKMQEDSRKWDTDSLVLKTGMVDVGKLVVINAPNYVRTFDFVPHKTNGVFGADHRTRISYIYSRLPITYSLTF